MHNFQVFAFFSQCHNNYHTDILLDPQRPSLFTSMQRLPAHSDHFCLLWGRRVARRYRDHLQTNQMFSRWMCNVSAVTSQQSRRPASRTYTPLSCQNKTPANCLAEFFCTHLHCTPAPFFFAIFISSQSRKRRVTLPPCRPGDTHGICKDN